MTAGVGASGGSGGELDGFHIGYLPSGIGEQVSDFATEWEDVRFASRVWERQVEDGYRVDLRVHVLRGERLTTLRELRDFLAEYHEHDPADWALTEFPNGESDGLIGDAEAFWLVEPGTALDVLVDPARFDADALRVVAQSIVALRWLDIRPKTAAGVASMRASKQLDVCSGDSGDHRTNADARAGRH